MHCNPSPSFKKAPQNTQAPSGLYFLFSSIADLAVHGIGILSRFLVIFQQSDSMIEVVSPIATFFQNQRMFATTAYFDQDMIFIEQTWVSQGLSLVA